MTSKNNFWGGGGYAAIGYQMIRTVDIRHFRCYEHLAINDVGRLNVITGDNGSGKTSLLEAIFLPLSAGSEVAMRLRQQRGMDGIFSASARKIEESLWGDFFHQYDMKRPVSITLKGDGDESRSLTIARGRSGVTLPLDLDSSNQSTISAPISFTWKNAAGHEAVVVPQFSEGKLTFPDTGEDMPDFFYIPALGVIGTSENAQRFSDLSKANKQEQFVKIFTKEFENILGMNLEMNAGSPAIYVTVKGAGNKIPLPNLSTGVNRMVAILLAIASRPKSIVLVDEIENGIHYSHHSFMWKAIIDLIKQNDSQLFVSSHSAECLQALGENLARNKIDAQMWQTASRDNNFSVRQVAEKSLTLALKYGDEVR